MTDAAKRRAYLLYQQALSLIYPRVTCAACGAGGKLENGLCADCRDALAYAPPGSPGVLLYEDTGAALLRQLKFHGERDIALWLGAQLIHRLPDGPWDALVPAPLSRKSRRARGYNQARAIALAIWLNGGPPVLDALQKTRETAQQARLSRAQRAENVRGAYAACRSVAGRSLLVIDDIYTTGATAGACIEALLAAGARRAGAFCAAYTPPPQDEIHAIDAT